jgi:hypothetical protein
MDYSTQRELGSLHAQPQNMDEPKPPDTCSRVSFNKRTRSISEEYYKEAKQTKDNHWLHSTTISNQYSALQEHEQQQHNGSGNKPKPPPIYISDVTTISPLIQLLEQIAKHQYELKVLPNNQIKIQPQTLDSYRTIAKVLAEKRSEFHIFDQKMKETIA